MKTIISKLTAAVLALGIGFGATAALAAGGPTNKPREVDWSFSGPFGKWDLGQLQRGYQVYSEVCAGCHSIELLSFRNLQEIGFSEAEVKAIASEFDVIDGFDSDGEPLERTAKPSDRIPGPFTNDEQAIAAHGIVPPDFSLLAKARAPERGFPTFVFDIFTTYAENGSDYIYSLLTGYSDPDESGPLYSNPYFIAGDKLSMAPPLSDNSAEEGEEEDYYNDGTVATIDQQAKDVTAFMTWAAEPYLVERKQLGFKVMVFLLILTVLLYLSKKQVFAGMKKD